MFSRIYGTLTNKKRLDLNILYEEMVRTHLLRWFQQAQSSITEVIWSKNDHKGSQFQKVKKVRI